MIRDYFSDLELTASASEEDIRQAYKRLARKFHPDLNLGFGAEDIFKRIQEAYDYLKSKTRVGKLKKILSLRNEIEEKSDTWKLPAALTSGPVLPGQNFRPNFDIEVLLSMPSKDLQKKTEEMVTYSVNRPCVTCKGRGGEVGSVTKTCKRCAGRGLQSIQRGAMNWTKSCDNCLGKGHTILRGCGVCHGRGRVLEKRSITVVKPSRGNLSVVKSAGHYSDNGLKRGDLWVRWETND